MEPEGVTKFQLHWEAGEPPAAVLVRELEHWRTRLKAVGGVGADPRRYGGIGYGNLSRRVAQGFWITGTQTGALDRLGPEHFCLVTDWDIATNTVWAKGPLPPSSEAMSHAAFYVARPEIQWVFHAHFPTLWHQARDLQLACTPAPVAYGTPAMAQAVGSIAKTQPLPLLVAMLGHEDGILAAGATAKDTGQLLLRAVARAART
ncbi:MAG: class II aldolase/adducin family protein [Acidithiobacillus sp.]|nr:class II aldolase/adducin family protein [Acidithiobacillus sp.]